MRGTVGRSSGKFILLGEHFVVHGVAAIALPLPMLECEVRIHPSSHPKYTAEFPDNQYGEVVQNLMARATYAAADAMRVDLSSQPLAVQSKANFPVSHGLGSSAAFSVALARAFDLYRKSLDSKLSNADWIELSKAANAVEKIFHGNPSGIDAAVIFAGRPILFENSKVIREIKNRAADFVILDSGPREQSSKLIEKVTKFKNEYSDQWDSMAKKYRTMVHECEKELGSASGAKGVASITSDAHGVLTELGLSNPTIDGYIQEAKKFGVLAGKVSGAGCGGAVALVVEPGEGKRTFEVLKSKNLPVIAYSEAEE